MYAFQPERLKRIGINILKIALLGALYYLFIRLTGLRIPCISHALFHFYCPGCGVTRMCVALIEGNLALAFRQNPFVLCLLPLLALWGGYRGYRYVYNKAPGFSMLEKIALIIVFLGAIAFTVFRNLPGYEFLAPM